MNLKKPLLIGATVATISLGSLGAVSAASAANTDGSSDSNPMSSLVEKISSKFNLSQDDVQAVFDEERSEHEADMKADQAERIKQAVTDGKLTQEQADYITKAFEEINALRGGSSPEDEDDTVRDQIRTKMDGLHSWAEEQNLELRDIVGGRGHGGFGGHGGPRGESNPDDADSSSDSSESDSETSNS